VAPPLSKASIILLNAHNGDKVEIAPAVEQYVATHFPPRSFHVGLLTACNDGVQEKERDRDRNTR